VIVAISEEMGVTAFEPANSQIWDNDGFESFVGFGSHDFLWLTLKWWHRRHWKAKALKLKS